LPHNKNQRIFNIELNDNLVADNFNMVATYPDKYGIKLISKIRIDNGVGLNINLKAIEGEAVISEILIENLN